MPNLTENYGLKKPLPEEFYDVNVQNENMDTLDEVLKNKAPATQRTKFVEGNVVSVGTAGWYRIAEMNLWDNGLFFISNQNKSGSSHNLLFYASPYNDTGARIVVMNNSISSTAQIITKIRIVRMSANNARAIDVYYNRSGSNPMSASCITFSYHEDGSTVNMANWTPVDETVDGETVMVEKGLSITANGHVLTDATGVKKSGDTMTDALIVNSSGVVGVKKYRTIDDVLYSNTIGMYKSDNHGVFAGFELTKGENNSRLSYLGLFEDKVGAYLDGNLREVLHSGNFGNYAAPAGYGYGEPCISFYHTGDESMANFESALNAVIAGMKDKEAKQINFTCTGIASTTFYGTVYRHTENYVVVTGKTYLQNGSVIKTKFNGKWDSHEWENPAMEVGKEYRTTERIDGKAVYAKRIHFGYLPNKTTLNVPHEITGKKWNVRYSIDTNWTNKLFGDCPEISSVYADSTNISITTTSDMSTTVVYFTLWYTKD